MRFRSFVAFVIAVMLIVILREYSFAILFLAYVFYAPTQIRAARTQDNFV